MSVACRGERKTIIWAEVSGASPAREYFEELTPADKVKILALFERMAEHGQIRNEQKFRKEEGSIWAFKSFQHRLYCFFDGTDVVVTNGVRKKSNRASREDLQRANRIRSEYLAAKRKDR